MADGTESGGSPADLIKTEDIGSYKLAVSKIYLGAHGVDGGAVTTSNPLPVVIQASAAVIGHTIVDSGSVTVSNFPGSQAVTGTFWQTTQPVSIATMPSTPVTGTFWQNTQPVSIATMPSTPVTGTFWQTTQPVNGTITANIGTAGTLALETGGNLASINTKTPALGQALAAAAVPVVLTAIQQTALTPPAAITGFALEAGNLATLVAKDFATQTTLASLNTKVTACNTGAVVLATGSAVIGHVIVDTAPTTAITAASLPLPTGASTSAKQPALGTAGSASTDVITVQGIASGIPQPVSLVAGTSGGWTPSHALTAASNNATSVKTTPGQLGGINFSNTNAATRYVKFYDKASTPSPATDAVKWPVTVPGGSLSAPSVVLWNNAEGIAFSTGIAYAVVANMSDTDNTSVTAGDMSVDILYK